MQNHWLLLNRCNNKSQRNSDDQVNQQIVLWVFNLKYLKIVFVELKRFEMRNYRLH